MYLCACVWHVLIVETRGYQISPCFSTPYLEIRSLTESEAHLFGNTSCQAHLSNALVPLTQKSFKDHFVMYVAGDPNSRLYTDPAGTLSTEPLLQTPWCILANPILSRGTVRSLLSTWTLFLLLFGCIMEAYTLLRKWVGMQNEHVAHSHRRESSRMLQGTCLIKTLTFQ